MKREWICGALLMGLLLLSLLNIAHLDRLTGELERELAAAAAYAEAGDYPAAEKALESAISRWKNADSYTHIFIRHPEIDGTSDALFELKELLLEQNAEGLPAGFEKVFYHLDSIDEMEHLRLGSIL